MLKEYTSTNIQFLRQGVDLTSQELALLVDIDLKNIEKYENGGELFQQEDSEARVAFIDDLVKIGHYFTVFLDDMIFSDLPNDQTFNIGIFDNLKVERHKGQPYNRIQFLNGLLEEPKEMSQIETDIENLPEVYKISLREIHKTYKNYSVQRKLYHLPKKQF